MNKKGPDEKSSGSFLIHAEESLEPRVQGCLRSATVGAKPRSPRPRAPRPCGLRRSVRREKGSLDLFLNPSHPISCVLKLGQEMSEFFLDKKLSYMITLRHDLSSEM